MLNNKSYPHNGNTFKWVVMGMPLISISHELTQWLILLLVHVPKKIISNKDVKFTSKFSKELFVSLGIELGFSTTYHLQTYG